MKKLFSLITVLGIFIAGCQQQAPTSTTTPSPVPSAIVVEAPVLGSVPIASTPPKIEDRKVEIKVEKQDSAKEATVHYEAYNAKIKLGKGKVEESNNTAILTIPDNIKEQEFTLSLTFLIKKDSTETGRAFHGIPLGKDVKTIVISIDKKDGIITATFKVDGKSNKTVIEIN